MKASLVDKPSDALESQPLEGAYHVVPIPDSENERMRRIVNAPRGPTLSVPNTDVATSYRMADEIFTEFGLDQYVGCVTAEMKHRPIPFVFRTEETANLTQLYVKWAPLIFRRIFSEIVPPVQTYNKISRLGWPYFSNPENKGEILRRDFKIMSEEGVAKYKSAFVIVGLRLQAESKKKEREFLFLTDDFRVVKRTVTARERTIEVKGLGERVTSRFRGVNNMPLPNLWKQVLDTAIHNAFLRYPAFHHDMFNNRILPVEGAHACFDVKHFERFTADAVRHRGRLFGGMYAEIDDIFSRIPYAVPTENRKRFAFIYPNRDEGWSDQFASGDSAVAPVQKEIFTALYAEYFATTRKLTPTEAIETVFQGGDGQLAIRNYGDDNSVSGDPKEIEDVYAFLKNYLHVEYEEPPKFLGFVWKPERVWRLPLESYLTKTYLNERAPLSNFRPYPNLGWVEKRKVYLKHGEAVVGQEVYPYEDKLLLRYGQSWPEVERKADAERRDTLLTPGQLSPLWLLGKDYAMTADEKLSTGEFIGLQPQETAPIIIQLLGVDWRKHLAFH